VDTWSLFQNEENGFFNDRRLRADGLIIRALREPLRATRANPVLCTDTHHPHKGRGSSKFKMKRPNSLKVVDCVRMASSSVRKRRSARADFSSVQGLPSATRTLACNARQPRPLYGYTPSVQRTRFFKIQNEETEFLKGRRLRADGFIIRAQATIRTDGFFVRAGLAISCANTCAQRAPTPSFVRIHTIRTKNEVLNVSPVGSP
jgi:hypothetical protein